MSKRICKCVGRFANVYRNLQISCKGTEAQDRRLSWRPLAPLLHSYSLSYTLSDRHFDSVTHCIWTGLKCFNLIFLATTVSSHSSSSWSLKLCQVLSHYLNWFEFSILKWLSNTRTPFSFFVALARSLVDCGRFSFNISLDLAEFILSFTNLTGLALKYPSGMLLPYGW